MFNSNPYCPSKLFTIEKPVGKGPSAPAVRLGCYQSSKKIHLFISNSANKAEVCCLDRFLLSCVPKPLKRRDAGTHRIALKTRTEQLVHFAVRIGGKRAISTTVNLRAQPRLSQPISHQCRVTMAFSDSSICRLKQAQWKKGTDGGEFVQGSSLTVQELKILKGAAVALCWQHIWDNINSHSALFPTTYIFTSCTINKVKCFFKKYLWFLYYNNPSSEIPESYSLKENK